MANEDIVNGHKVEARQRAKIDDHRSGKPAGTLIAINTVDEVLLETGEVIFECVHPNRGDCRQTYGSPRSVLAHQKVHAARAEARRLASQVADLEAKKAAVEVERNGRKQRASDRAKLGAATRRQRLAEKPTETVAADDPRVLLSSEIETRIKKLRAQLVTVENELSKVIDGLDDLTAVAGLVANLPGADATTLEKARRYDILTTPITNPIK